MTSPWDVLGIEPTSDCRRIRSAYAARLKSTPPEDDPEGFQRLRQAYEWAVFYASLPASPPGALEPPAPPVEPGPEPRLHEVVDELLARVASLYDGEQRRSVMAWRELLLDDALWSLPVREALQERLFGFLLEHRDLTYPIWRLLEGEFQWTVLSQSLYARFDPESVDELLDEIHEALANDPEAPLRIEPIEEEERSGGVPWWGLLFALIVLGRIPSALGPDPADQARRAQDALERMRQSQHERASRLAEIEAAQQDPALFQTMDQETLELAAERQILVAQWELGRRYLGEDGVGRNDTLARMWLSRAAANGHERAARELERLDER